MFHFFFYDFIIFILNAIMGPYINIEYKTAVCLRIKDPKHTHTLIKSELER